MEDTEEYGQVKPKLISAPSAPSRQERMEHDIAHIPFRAWCKACVAGKCKSDKHTTSQDRSEDSIPVIGIDYAFLDKTMESGKMREEMTVMVVKDRMSGCIFSIPVPQKGMDPHEYATRQLLKKLNWLGYIEVIIKSDNEAALIKVIESVKIHRGAGTRTGTEKSPVGDSKANGEIERANQTLEGQVRTLCHALEDAMGGWKIEVSDHIFAWLVIHAGNLINRFAIKKERKTPHEKIKGRKSKRLMV